MRVEGKEVGGGFVGLEGWGFGGVITNFPSFPPPHCLLPSTVLGL